MRGGRSAGIYLVLVVLLFLLALASVIFGAVEITVGEIGSALAHALSGETLASLNERIFLQIRLPRVIMGIFVGATLTIGGVLLQALFRNPIVEPGLVGTSSGAAFGASLYFVLGAAFGIELGEWGLPLAACIGGMVSTTLVFYLARSRDSGRSSVIALLLTGVAVNALFLSGVGFLSYIARDPQARSITFWNLGTLSGAYWGAVGIVGAVTGIGLWLSLRYAKQLNALMLGEQEAQLLGVSLGQLKLKVLAVNVVMVAVATAFVGVIAFVGLIVPHFLRMLNGSDNRFLLGAGALTGAIVLTASDLAARLLVSPAELPLGIVTSVIGTPIFILLLRRTNYLF
ncbi:FecCD family ABC transporter permease [Lewinella sp. IMCC34183]|uniref:FecCD family ABC transporter permease n=1 Tax=Lewinella sp. IMCC34183 TaxID=2248762 RepID=UPI000E239F5F|nr:iron ABC transporter permease [Lewinella sp. IMCC34183]